jgi:Spy/CpxP family protein refolding chaperone
MRLFILAATAATALLTAGIASAPADAQPGWHGRQHHGWHDRRHHRRQVCRTVWHNHHRVRRCSWR